MLFLFSCRTYKKEILKIEIKEGQFLIECTLNDSLKGKFLIDTGTSNTIITPNVLKKLNLNSKGLDVPENAYTGNPNINLSEINVVTSPVEVSFQSQSRWLSPVYVLDIDNLLSNEGIIQGWLGMDFLRNIIITVDYKDSLLVIEDKKGLSDRLAEGTKIPVEWKGINYFDVTMNETVKTKYNLDTGLPVTSISLSDFSRLGLNENSPAVEKISYPGFGGEIPLLSTKLNTFSIGEGLEVRDLEVHVLNEEFCAIGTNYLTHFVVTFNFGENYIILRRFNIKEDI